MICPADPRPQPDPNPTHTLLSGNIGTICNSGVKTVLTSRGKGGVNSQPPFVPCTAAQHSTAQHSTAQHSTAQHSTAQHTTAQHSTAHHSTAQHSTAQYSAAQYSAAQYNIFLGCVLRGTIVDRTYGRYKKKKLYIYLLLLTIFGPVYYGLP